MSEQYWTKFSWGSALSAIALFTGTFCILTTPAEAAPEAAKGSLKLEKLDFKLAQVGVSSQINAPVPLNLRPRTHIPLPTNSRSSDYDRYSRYDGYGDGHEYEHHHHRGNHRSQSGTVIIINPANQSSYESYGNQDGYIRIIRK